MTKEVGVGQAHSKIILTGEHAVVYGYPAISLPLLEVEVTCRVVPAATPWRLFEEDTLSMAVYASLEYLNIKDACIRCQIDSAIPEKRGMGSSAAISIAAIRAVFDYYQAELPHDVLEILVNRIAAIFRGRDFIDQHCSQMKVPTSYRNLRMDLENHTVYRGDEMIALTRREYDLLATLMGSKKVLTREQLLESVWKYESATETNIVDVYIRYLRSKLDVKGQKSYIKTVRGVGYTMQE